MRVIFLFIRHSYEIICADTVKFAKSYKIVYLQFRPAVLNMTVALLRFIYHRADLFLRQILVLAKISHSCSIIH